MTECTGDTSPGTDGWERQEHCGKNLIKNYIINDTNLSVYSWLWPRVFFIYFVVFCRLVYSFICTVSTETLHSLSFNLRVAQTFDFEVLRFTNV